MQIKEFEAETLKECLQQVRTEMGPDAVILETRKFRKGGVMGMGARDAVAIVAATGITVNSDADTAPALLGERAGVRANAPAAARTIAPPPVGERVGVRASATSAASVAARGVYGRSKQLQLDSRLSAPAISSRHESDPYTALLDSPDVRKNGDRTNETDSPLRAQRPPVRNVLPAAWTKSADEALQKAPSGEQSLGPAELGNGADCARFEYLERAMREIRESLTALHREQQESHDRTVCAVVSAVAPAVTAVHAAGFAAYADDLQPRFPDLQARLRQMGLSDMLIQELIDQLPDMGAWSEQAQEPLAHSALKDLMSRRVVAAGAIRLTPGKPKVVALIGATGVGKTTTIAKLAAHFALMQGKRVGLITVDTYRIAAVDQLKTYSQIIGLPVNVAYSPAELPPILQEYADYDLVLIDTAGRSQQHSEQIGELKAILDAVDCESHLVLSAPTKEHDMLDAARRFSAAHVDRLIFSKLDETTSYGTLLSVADKTGLPVSYFTTGQNVPEDLEAACGTRLAGLILP